MYQFILDIGDYSFDGHGRNLTYRVEAAKDVAQARVAHLLIPAQTGIDMSSFCNGYEDKHIPDYVIERLKVLGYEFPPHRVDRGKHYLETEDLGEDMPDTMAELWVFLLNLVDPDLHARILPESDEPPHLLIPGAGLHSIGYGLF